jgi:hypothetical protein
MTESLDVCLYLLIHIVMPNIKDVPKLSLEEAKAIVAGLEQQRITRAQHSASVLYKEDFTINEVDHAKADDQRVA